MKIITEDDLLQLLSNTEENRISLLYRKPVKMNKKENPFYRKEGRSFIETAKVEKEVEAVYEFGANYSEKVNEAIKEKNIEGNFEAKAVPWAETVVKDKLVRHKETGKLYIKVYPLKDETPMKVSYYVDEEPASEEDMKTIDKFEIRKDASVKTQENAGLEKSEQIKTFLIDLNNVIKITIGDEEYYLN